MTCFDVANGDADGLCALHQLRLSDPLDAVLVTGVKRDIALLARVVPDARPGDRVTVTDLSLAVNRPALAELLGRGVHVSYFDHHAAGAVPRHPLLEAHIDPAPDQCASTVVDRHLGGAHRAWAVVGAFGDNLRATAAALAAALGLDAEATDTLRRLGENLNYNGYGDTEADLVIAPGELYRRLAGHAEPWSFVAAEPVLGEIDAARLSDLALARAVEPVASGPAGVADTDPAGARVYVLPDAPWSRRVRGAFGNELALADPATAHAVATPNARGGLVISIRAPLEAPLGADDLARSFPTGGGRAAAAGINDLPPEDLPAFVGAFGRAFPRP